MNKPIDPEGMLKASEKDIELAKMLIVGIFKEFRSKAPKGEKIKRMDSNLFHFIVYEVAEKVKLPLARGWFIHGPYVPAVDDALVELGIMEKKYHQLQGTDMSMMEPMVEYTKNGN